MSLLGNVDFILEVLIVIIVNNFFVMFIMRNQYTQLACGWSYNAELSISNIVLDYIVLDSVSVGLKLPVNCLFGYMSFVFC